MESYTVGDNSPVIGNLRQSRAARDLGIGAAVVAIAIITAALLTLGLTIGHADPAVIGGVTVGVIVGATGMAVYHRLH